MQPVTLTTPRLVLSTPVEADIDAIYAACQDELIQEYTTVPSPYTRADAEGFVAKVAGWWDAGEEAIWAIRHEGTLVGVVGLHKLGGKTGGDGEIGFWMAAAHRGNGYLVEACRAVLDWAFGPALSLQRVAWRAVAGNTGSARVAQALGFHYEGTLRAALRGGRGGPMRDGWIAGLLPADDRTRQPWPVLAD